MAEICKDLPEECWELVFSRLGHHSHLEPLSLVCKRFLSITNRLRRRLTVIDPTVVVHGTISELLRRFQFLINIDLRAIMGDLDTIVFEIARSGLSLEALDISNHESIPIEGLRELGLKMKSLKVLKCAFLWKLRDRDLVAIANSLPCLEELDISYPQDVCSGPIVANSGNAIVTDSGIISLASNLRNLRKIDISGNHFITDQSLAVLSSNCVLLREVSILECQFVTTNGIYFVLRNCRNLRSISVNGFQIPLISSAFDDMFSCARTLCTLHFSDMLISDQFLSSIAKACIPLKSLSLSYCMDFTFCGVSLLLSAYQSLEYLALIKADFLTDHSISVLCQYLCNLHIVKLSYCSKLTNATFFNLAKNCSLLKNIEINKTNLGKGDCVSSFSKYLQIKSLHLAQNRHLSDEFLQIIAQSCPRLELLDVCSCLGITEGGIAEILKRCYDVRILWIDDCKGVTSVGIGSELPKLEVLRAAGSGINDEGLVMIGKRCCGLLNLNLAGCFDVTSIGVEELMKHCERLRCINLNWCRNVSINIVDWMVLSSPSLRKIILPCSTFLTESRMKFYLRHGCVACGPATPLN